MSEYEDMSPWAVHFASSYDAVMSILWDGKVEPVAAPHGVAGEISELDEMNRPACFSEIPLHLLARICERRSEYGVGFAQRFLRSRGGARLWYVEEDTEVAAALKDAVKQRSENGVDVHDPLWKVTPFIDIATTKVIQGDYVWEREWRVPGGLRFEPTDVAFLFIPERLQDQARQFFTDVAFAGHGPGYLRPYIDVRWDQARIAEELAKAPAKLDPSQAAVASRMGDVW